MTQANDTTTSDKPSDERPRCWWCEKEIWPLMDQRKDEQGNLMHAYCYIRYQRAKLHAGGIL